MLNFLWSLKKIISFIYKRNKLNFYIYSGRGNYNQIQFVEVFDRAESDRFINLKYTHLPTKNILINELAKGSSLNVVTNSEGYVCHYSCVTNKGVRIGEIDIFFKLTNKQIYIYNCKTEEAGLRKGLYRAALSEIIKSNPDKDIYICSLDWNLASIKCLESVGFKAVFAIDYLKVFGVKRYRSNNEEVSRNVIGL